MEHPAQTAGRGRILLTRGSAPSHASPPITKHIIARHIPSTPKNTTTMAAATQNKIRIRLK
ncbi:MAG TPA: hypothetical protein VES65_09065, partial [Solirubrobacteraceae bacterium]|nr:hypothetical protein [Solirubrobacteraceae bacterium]